MKKTNRIFTLLLCVLAILSLSIAGCGEEKEYSPYLKAISDSSKVTTSELTTKITEGETVVFEENVKVSKGIAVKVETTTKTLAGLESEQDFDTATETEFYTESLRYYLLGNEWKTEPGTYRANEGISLSEFDLSERSVTASTLTAQVKSSAYGKFVSQRSETDEITEMTVTISLNADETLSAFTLSYRTAKRNVSITATYGYSAVTVVLPVLG